MGVALTSECRFKHGCLVVKHSKILGVSPNVRKNDPRYVLNSSVHAEIRALRRAGWPRKATIYIARINALGEKRLSKPCLNCQQVLDGLQCRAIWTE